MRKIVLAFALILVLASCTSKPNLSVAKVGYTCDAKITAENDITFSAKLFVLGGGVFKAKILMPEYLSKIWLEFLEEKCTVSYDGVEGNFALNEEFLGPLSFLNGAFLKLSTGSPSMALASDEAVLDGVYKTVDFRFCFNDEGFPTKLEFKNINLKAEFSNWTYQKNK